MGFILFSCGLFYSIRDDAVVPGSLAYMVLPGQATSDAASQKRTLTILLRSNKVGLHSAPVLQSLELNPRQACVFHTDINRMNESDVVVMKSELLQDEGEIPERYFPNQKWIYYGWEASRNSLPEEHPEHCRKFNLTMTYSKTSDIHFPYGECTPRTNIYHGHVTKVIKDILGNKTRLAAWIVSNCHSNSQRESYVRELLRHIPIDVYGYCVRVKCTLADCPSLINTYKFYIAFENSLCGEYITEKVWKCYEWNVIPVVYGALETYKSTLPPHSYIDAAEFPNPESLANYLLLLDKNDTLYKSYFDWKYTINCGRTHQKYKGRRLCQYLHDHVHDRNDNLDLKTAWSAHSTRCLEAKYYLTSLGLKNRVTDPFGPDDVMMHNRTLEAQQM